MRVKVVVRIFLSAAFLGVALGKPAGKQQTSLILEIGNDSDLKKSEVLKTNEDIKKINKETILGTKNEGFATVDGKIDEESLNSKYEGNKTEENSAILEEESSLTPQGRVLYNGSQLWKVIVDNKDKKATLYKLREQKDVSMWGGNHTAVDVLVHSRSLEKVQKELKENGISYDITIEDVQKAIDEENPPHSELDDELEQRQAKKLPPRYVLAWRGLTSLGNRLDTWPQANWGHRMTWHAYHKFEDISGYLDYLAETYPQLCSVYTIGKSNQGRDLKVLKISNGKPGNKAIWIDGGIHAREWISPASVTYIINHLVLNYDSESEQIQNIDWYFLPVANPDGYVYSHHNDRLWRKNRARSGLCAGTDLNRNYGYKWGGKGNGRNPCQEIYGGSGPFSEPETAAIKNFVMNTAKANWKASISFHSYGQYILYPWGYDRVVPPDHKDLESVGQKAASAMRKVDGKSYRVGPAANTLYPAAGGSDDWAKGVVGMKYSYTIELRDQGRYGFILPASFIQPTAKEALAATKVIAEAAGAA